MRPPATPASPRGCRSDSAAPAVRNPSERRPKRPGSRSTSGRTGGLPGLGLEKLAGLELEELLIGPLPNGRRGLSWVSSISAPPATTRSSPGCVRPRSRGPPASRMELLDTCAGLAKLGERLVSGRARRWVGAAAEATASSEPQNAAKRRFVKKNLTGLGRQSYKAHHFESRGRRGGGREPFPGRSFRGPRPSARSLKTESYGSYRT
jgi:hypothetical protein